MNEDYLNEEWRQLISIAEMEITIRVLDVLRRVATEHNKSFTARQLATSSSIVTTLLDRLVEGEDPFGV